MPHHKAQEIDQLRGPPVVGRFYRVPTVRHDWHGMISEWPVMGPKHDDEELSFYYHHYHIDVRFLNDRQARKMARSYKTRAELFAVPALTLATASSPLHASHHHPELAEPVIRLRRCRTNSHDYPVEYAIAHGPRHLEMAETYANRPCGRDSTGQLICPHKGFALGSLVPNEQGHIVCPLHGLIIDTQTGRIAKPSKDLRPTYIKRDRND